MTKFRIRPYDDYSTAEGDPLDWVLSQELDDESVLKNAVRLILSNMHESGHVSDYDVLNVLNQSRSMLDGEWEVVE